MEFNPDQKQKLLNSVLKKHIEHFDFNPDSFGMSKAHLILSSSSNIGQVWKINSEHNNT